MVGRRALLILTVTVVGLSGCARGAGYQICVVGKNGSAGQPRLHIKPETTFAVAERYVARRCAPGDAPVVVPPPIPS
jgi:hypothetical protein